MAEFYSERHGRKPPLDVDGLVQFVFTEFAELERRGYFWEAFNSYEIHGEEHGARLPQPERYVITKLGRPGLWKWLGDAGRVVAEDDFPTWDRDTLFDVVELFHNVVVAAPILDADGTFEGYSRSSGQSVFREKMNEGLALADPPARLIEDGRIVETVEDNVESEKKSSKNNISISHVHEKGNDAAERLAESLTRRGFQVTLADQLTTAAGPSGSQVAVLGPGFLERNWTRTELDLLADREPSDGREPIILVSHGIDADQVREVDPLLAQRPDLSIDLGLDHVVEAIARALQRGRDDEPQIPGTGIDDDGEVVSLVAKGHGSLFGWFVEHKDQILIGLFVGTVLLGIGAAIKWVPGSSDPNSQGENSVEESGGIDSVRKPEGSEPVTAGGATASEVVEWSDNKKGSPVFSDPMGRPVEGKPTRIPYETKVVVSCFAKNESGMPSVSGFYRIASGEWQGDYVVTDTMTNGGEVGDAATPAVDGRVQECPDEG
jgi:hypothetical protein